MSEPIPTTCMRCAVGCGHLQHGADRGYGLGGISGDPAHPVSQGLACGRGLRETPVDARRKEVVVSICRGRKPRADGRRRNAAFG